MLSLTILLLILLQGLYFERIPGFLSVALMPQQIRNMAVHDSEERMFKLAEDEPQKCTPGMFDELYRLDWNGIQTTGSLPRRWTLDFRILQYHPPQLFWLMDHGLIIDKAKIQSIALGGAFPRQSTTVAAIIERHGNADVFRDKR